MNRFPSDRRADRVAGIRVAHFSNAIINPSDTLSSEFSFKRSMKRTIATFVLLASIALPSGNAFASTLRSVSVAMHTVNGSNYSGFDTLGEFKYLGKKKSGSIRVGVYRYGEPRHLVEGVTLHFELEGRDCVIGGIQDMQLVNTATGESVDGFFDKCQFTAIAAAHVIEGHENDIENYTKYNFEEGDYLLTVTYKSGRSKSMIVQLETR